MKPSKKKRKQKCKRGWSRDQILSLIAIVLQLIIWILDRFS